jgi:hypothetical protein
MMGTKSKIFRYELFFVGSSLILNKCKLRKAIISFINYHTQSLVPRAVKINLTNDIQKENREKPKLTK